MRGFGCAPMSPYLQGFGDDSTGIDSTDISGAISATDSIDTSNIALLSQPGGPLAAGGVLDPGASDQVSVQQLANYVQTGQASDPTTASQLAAIVAAAGPSVTGILQQVQLGQLAATTPISQLAALRSAITGSASGSAILSSITSDPTTLLIIGGVLLLLFARRGD